MSVRVLHVLDSLGVGGAQDLVLSWVRRFDPLRVQAHLCVLHGPLGVWGPIPAGVRAVSLGSGRWDLLRIVPRLARLLARGGYDIVHAHLFASGAMVGSLSWAGWCRARRVLSVHAHRRHVPPWDYPVYRALSGQYDAVLTQVDTSPPELRAAGIPAAKIRLVPVGIDPSRVVPRGTDVRGELGIPPEAPLVTRIARFHPEKGYEELLAAAEAVWRRVPGAYFLLVGDEGTHRRTVEVLARAVSLPGQVRISGFRTDLGDILAASTVVAAPSLREGLGMATLAALAAGIPVVAYDVGAVSQAVRDGETGRLVRAGDRGALASAIAGLLLDAPARQRMGERGRRLASEAFPADAMVRGLEAVYERLAGARGGTGAACAA